MRSCSLSVWPSSLTLPCANNSQNCRGSSTESTGTTEAVFTIVVYVKGSCVTNLGLIWLDPHNFLLWSHGRLLSMKSLVRVLPAAAYTFNMVPIYDPGGPNPHGRVWRPFPVPVRDFTLRSHYPREAGLPKPDSDPAPDSLGIGLSPNSSQKYTVLYLELIRSLLDPFQGSHTIIGTSDSFRLPLTHSELPWLGLSLGMFHKVHGPVPWTNPCTIRSFSGVPHYYWDVGLL